MSRRLRTWICLLIAICIIFGIVTSFTNLENHSSKATNAEDDSSLFITAENSYVTAAHDTPKNIFLFLKSTNSTVDCLIEHIVREYADYKVYVYFDPSLKEKPKSMETLMSAYNNIEVKENAFEYERFLESNFTRHSRLLPGFVKQFKRIMLDGVQTIDKQFVPMLDLWLHGGLYFSVNITYDLIDKTKRINELYNFHCEKILVDSEKHLEKHKICKINFVKVEKLDCIVELAIKNYLLYFEKHKSYNFNRMFMNLYNNQNKILSRKNKISQNQYLTCFKSKLKHFRKQIDSLEHLFTFTDSNLSMGLVKKSEDSCPLIDSMDTNSNNTN